jgi:hypothetical protein
MLLEDRPEATRSQWRISGQKGWRGVWSPPDLGIGVEGGSADVGRGEIWKVDGCLLVLESTQIMGARPH